VILSSILACGINIVVQSDEADIVTRKNVIHISADLDVVSSETAEIPCSHKKDDKPYNPRKHGVLRAIRQDFHTCKTMDDKSDFLAKYTPKLYKKSIY